MKGEEVTAEANAVEPRLDVKFRSVVGAIAWRLELEVRLLRVRRRRRAWKGRRTAGRRTWSTARRITAATGDQACDKYSRAGGRECQSGF